MFGHTSARFLLLSIMLLGMAAMVLCTCNYSFGETCEQICSCSNHVCCSTTSPVKKNQCMTPSTCMTWAIGNGKRRAIQRQKRFLGMVRGLDS
uniref:Conotoxin superfamily I4 n=1 Tax=Conus ermineus TaxID=55423 RepID=A0A346CIU0_CONER|nr:conotoxin precursor superfamily I4 [Conus ermineus]